MTRACPFMTARPQKGAGRLPRWSWALVLLMMSLAWSASAKAPAQAAPKGKLKVAVSILPQAYFVERVGGQFVDVEVLVGPGQSPHAYEPTPKQLEGLSRARLYFSVGIDFEHALLPRVQQMFPGLRVIDTRAGVPLRSLSPAELDAEERDAAHGGHRDEDPDRDNRPDRPGGRPDPHIWLNPLLVKTQAQTICDALVAADAEHTDQYRRNLAAFQADLDRLHTQIAEALAPLKGKEVFVFHPAFGYFTDAYTLKQVPVEMAGKEPTARQLAALIDRAKAAGVKVIFVQPQFSRKSAEAIAQATGGVVVPMDDLAKDYLRNLEDMAAKIKAGLGRSSE